MSWPDYLFICNLYPISFLKMDLRPGNLIKDQAIWPVKSGVKLSLCFQLSSFYKGVGVETVLSQFSYMCTLSHPFTFRKIHCIRSNSPLFSFCYFIWKEMPARTKITQCQEANEKDDLSIIYGVFFDPSFSPVPFTLVCHNVLSSCLSHLLQIHSLPPSLPCLPNSPASRPHVRTSLNFWRLVATL